MKIQPSVTRMNPGSFLRTLLEGSIAFWKRWWRALAMIGIVFTVCGLSALLGFLFGKGSFIPGALVIGVVLACVAIWIIINHFAIMVPGILIACLAIPVDLPTGTATMLPASLLLSMGLLATWVISMYTRQTWRLTPSRLNAPLMTFGVLCIISMAWSTIWRDPVVRPSASFPLVQTAALVCYLTSLGTTLLIGNFVQTPGRLLFLMVTIVVVGAIIMICLAVGFDQPVLQARGLGLLWTSVCAFGLLVSIPKLSLPARTGLLIAIGLWFYWQVLVNATWLSGWIPTVVALGVATWFRSKRAAITLAVLGVLSYLASKAYFAAVFEADLEGGSTERLDLWLQSWEVFKHHWLFGTGPAGYNPYFVTYFPWDTRSSHNNYVDIVAQFGVIGTLAWFWLALTGVFEGWRAARRAPPGILRAAAIAGVGGWVGAQAGMFFGDWVLPFAYNITVSGFKHTGLTWLFLGMIISVNYQIDQKAHAT